jgi:hypothetical protein
VTASELLSGLEVAFGGICPAPKAAPSAQLLECTVNGDVFDKLLRHWQGLPAASRPRLRGLTLSREGGRLLLLELGARTPFLAVSVDAGWPARSLAAVWPYALWWEEELGGGSGGGEVTWRRG